MKNSNSFTYASPFGFTVENCEFRFNRYYNGNPALEIVNDEGPVCRCSVNPPDVILGDGEIAVKNWSENAGMDDWLKGAGMIIDEAPAKLIPSGFVEIPVYRLTEKAKSMFENN